MSEDVNNVAETTETGDTQSDIWADIKQTLPEAFQEEIEATESVRKLERDHGQKLPWQEDSADEADDDEDEEKSELEIDQVDEDDDEEVEEDEELEDDEELDVEEEDAEIAATTIITQDGEELSIPLDAIITVPVDGVDTQVSLKEVMNGISGQKAIAQRFSLLDQEKKQLEARYNEWNEGEANVRELMESGNVVDALDMIFQKGGFNSEAVMLQFFEQISAPLETYLSLPEEQREAWATKIQAERNRLQYEQVLTEKQQLQAKQEQLAEVRQVQTQYGLDDATFAELYYQLETDMEKGIVDKRPITADLVGKYHTVLERESWVMGALDATDPKLAKDRQVVSDVYAALGALGPDATEQDIKDLVQEAYGQPAKFKKAKAVSKVLRKKGSPKMTKQSQMKAAPNKSHRAKSSDDRPKHFLEQIVTDYDSAATAKDRRKVKEKWINKTKKK